MLIFKLTCSYSKFATLSASIVTQNSFMGDTILVSVDIHALLCDSGLAQTTHTFTSSSIKLTTSVRRHALKILKSVMKRSKFDVYRVAIITIGVSPAEVVDGA